MGVGRRPQTPGRAQHKYRQARPPPPTSLRQAWRLRNPTLPWPCCGDMVSPVCTYVYVHLCMCKCVCLVSHVDTLICQGCTRGMAFSHSSRKRMHPPPLPMAHPRVTHGSAAITMGEAPEGCNKTTCCGHLKDEKLRRSVGVGVASPPYQVATSARQE